LQKQLKDSPQQSTPNVSSQALQKLCIAVSLVHTLFLLNSVQILGRVERADCFLRSSKTTKKA